MSKFSRARFAIAAAAIPVSLAVAAVPASAAVHPAAHPAAMTYSVTGGLNAVAAASDHSAWAVGYAGVSNLKVLMLHWNGTSWSRVTSPSVLTGTGELSAIKVVSAKDAWAVGSTGEARERSLILHWNGSAWKAVTSPKPVSNARLSAVTATAKGGWAVGYRSTGETVLDTQPLIYRLSGKKWTRVDPSFGKGSGVVLNGVATTSAGITFATGLFTGQISGELARWTGHSWKWVASFPERGTYHWLNGIAAGPHGGAYALGPNTARRGVISIRWNGHAWVRATAPASASPNAVTVAPGGTAWSAGSRFSGTRYHMLILRWNGHAWRTETGPSTDGQLNGLGFAGAKYGWAVGATSPTSGEPKTFIAHWNGHSWS
ncbi:MAG TPA: hypothetical protein VGG25_31090 [Streptosporangiaceae bacterium]